MLQVFSILAPIFALIGLGYVTELRGWLGAGACSTLNRFVLRLALPAELFLLTAHLSLAELDRPGFAISYATGMMVTAGVAFAWDWRRPVERNHRMSGAAIESMSAGYANTAFIGIPVCLGVFGPHASAAITISTLLVVCVLFAIGIFLIELEEQSGGAKLAIAGRVVRTLLLNPIIFAPALGLGINAAGLHLPHAAGTLLELLGGAATPCALLTIGLFLAETRQQPAPLGAVLRVSALKLFVQPALTLLAARFVFGLPAIWEHEAVMLAALPTGTGPFMLARLYQREAGVASRVTLLGTIASIVTIGALIGWIGPGTSTQD